MLRTIPRSICQAARPSRPSIGKSCAASILREVPTQPRFAAGRSVRSWTSTTRPRSAGAAGQQVLPSQQLASSSAATQVLVRSKSSMASSAEWEHEGLPVAPLLRGSQELPANLKLAQEAWPEEEDGDGESQQHVCPAAFIGLGSVLSPDGLCGTHDGGSHLSLVSLHRLCLCPYCSSAAGMILLLRVRRLHERRWCWCSWQWQCWRPRQQSMLQLSWGRLSSVLLCVHTSPKVHTRIRPCRLSSPQTDCRQRHPPPPAIQLVLYFVRV